MKEECAFISSIMCKKGFLQLDPADVKEIVLGNAMKLAAMDIGAPVVYAGNSALKRGVETIFHRTGVEIAVVPNVFPDVDQLNVEPLRRRMQDLFSKHIIHAPGMERLKAISNHTIIPTPAAVLRRTPAVPV